MLLTYQQFRLDYQLQIFVDKKISILVTIEITVIGGNGVQNYRLFRGT